ARPGPGQAPGIPDCVARRRAPRACLRRAGSLSALDLLLQSGAGGEARHLAARDEDPLPRARVHALARAALGHGELAEAGEVHLAPALEDAGDRVQDRIDGLARLLLVADSAVAREHVEELSLGHV